MGTHSHTQASLTLLCSQSSPQSHILIANNIYSKESPTTNLAAVGGGRGGGGGCRRQPVGRIQNSGVWEVSWSCTNGVLFQPPLQKGHDAFSWKGR